MANRSLIRQSPLLARPHRGPAEMPSPFPLLIMVLVITAILLLRQNGEPRIVSFGIDAPAATAQLVDPLAARPALP